MSEDKDEGQMIYDVKVKVAYKVKKGNGYTNHYREMHFPTRMKSVADMNGSPGMIIKMMGFLGLQGKKVYDFHVKEEIWRKELSRSFAHKESEYEQESGE
jgi:hypothetical protein